METLINSEELESAAKLLRGGELVAFPTETVYGLGGSALSDSAVAAIYSAKGRPQFNPLIVHVVSIDKAQEYVEWNARAELLAQKFWPGPLTFVLPRKKDCKLSLLVSAGMDSVAIRIPAHPLALELLRKSDLPLAAPSANRSGRISPTSAGHVLSELGDKVKMVLDGGDSEVGIESTILDLTTNPATILRHGKVTQEELENYIELGEYESDIIKASGMMKSHYAPNAKMRLNATELMAGEALLAFGKPLAGADIVENLSQQANLEEAAANLFKMLRRLDAKNPQAIAVMKIPDSGIGLAINDRLKRAAADKD